MCQECGCGLGVREGTAGTYRIDEAPEAHSIHGSPTSDSATVATQCLEVQQSLLDRNQRLAEQNRILFRAKRLLVLNVVSAPGSGKTALIERTGGLLRGRLRVGVIVGDLATDNDARRLRAAGLPVAAISTGTLCHLEAEMVARAMRSLDLDSLDVLFIENVGNLVCPAAYDLGEALRVVLLSVTEGEDKPLKYPPLFHSADLAVITKTDMAVAAGFDREAAIANLRRVSHHARLLEVSSRSGEGMAEWGAYLVQHHAAERR